LSAIVLLSFLLTTTAVGLRAASPATLTVRLYNTAGIPQSELLNGRREAEWMLRETGLRPVFRHCGRAVSDAPADACDTARGPSEVVVRLVNAPASDLSPTPDAFGVAYVMKDTNRGWLATVFPDRIARAAARAGVDPGTLLGRVMAHEIGHLLLGAGYHGDGGVMRAEWNVDRLAGTAEDWRFSIDESARMQHQLEAIPF
jgi:hypothetical protein